MSNMTMNTKEKYKIAYRYARLVKNNMYIPGSGDRDGYLRLKAIRQEYRSKYPFVDDLLYRFLSDSAVYPKYGDKETPITINTLNLRFTNMGEWQNSLDRYWQGVKKTIKEYIKDIYE